MDNPTASAEPQRGSNHLLNVVLCIISGVATIALSWFAVSLHNQSNKMAGMHEEIAALQQNAKAHESRIVRRLEILEKWQKDWPQHGRLMEDVRQDTEIKHLAREIEETANELKAHLLKHPSK